MARDLFGSDSWSALGRGEFGDSAGIVQDSAPATPQWHPSAREWFAGMAMQGMMARALNDRSDTARLAFEQADAMVAEGRKVKP